MTQNGTFRRTRGPSRVLRLGAACCGVLRCPRGVNESVNPAELFKRVRPRPFSTGHDI